MKRTTSRRLPADAGLTILELMIVLVILSIIGVVVSFQVVGQMDRAKVDVAGLQLRQLQGALTLFALDTHRYPTGEEGLSALLVQPDATDSWRGPYIKNGHALEDPWGQALQYEPVGDGSGYLLTSLGADRKAGGEGAAAELVLGDRD
jgi:general secretion pathway protein G